MVLNLRQTKILNVLKNTDRALTAKEIRQRLGIPERELRQEVHDMRLQGVPIITGNFGYSLAVNKVQVVRTINRMKSQVKETNEAINALYKTLGDFGNDTI